MESLTVEQKNITWFKACNIGDIPENGGACVKYKDRQIAIFNFTRRDEWFATQNLCPHRFQMALSFGMIGEKKGEPKVACPFHKKTFSLETGKCMDDEQYVIKTYPVKAEEGAIFIGIEF
jgi:nitrite reductase (NADH) small subunit